jgi:hypothetical protein
MFRRLSGMDCDERGPLRQPAPKPCTPPFRHSNHPRVPCRCRSTGFSFLSRARRGNRSGARSWKSDANLPTSCTAAVRDGVRGTSRTGRFFWNRGTPRLVSLLHPATAARRMVGGDQIGIVVEFVKEQLTFTGADSALSKLPLSVKGAFAEFERSLLKERQREGIALAKIHSESARPARWAS